MQSSFRRLAWPICKALVALAILIAVALQFWRDLHHQDLTNVSLRWQWLVLSGFSYIAGFGFAGFYWYRLLWIFGQKPTLLAALRAYYISQLGKYLPGKAWALLMRGALIQGPEVKLSIALIATFYEVLTTMASGALLAAVLFTLWPPRLFGDWNPAWLGLLLLTACGLPILPGVFNRVVSLLARRLRGAGEWTTPQLGALTLFEGLTTTSLTWCCLGFSLWAMVNAVQLETAPLTAEQWLRYTAIIALALVAGFVAIVVPSGLGVREWVLDTFLTPELTAAVGLDVQPKAVLIVLLLRVAWTAGEVVVAGLLWPLPASRRDIAP
jgi:glycosyltransferase 2 family protein